MSIGTVIIPGQFGRPIVYAPFAAGPAAAALQAALVTNAATVALPLGQWVVYRRITNAELLAGVDLTFALAPGIGRTLIPMGVAQLHENSLAAFYNNTRTVNLAYTNNPTVALTTAQNAVVAVTAQEAFRFAGAFVNNLAPGLALANQPLVLHFSGGNAGGNAANFVDYTCTLLCAEGMAKA